MFNLTKLKKLKTAGITLFMLIYLLLKGGLIKAETSPVDYVNPFIGTANQKSATPNWKNGETFPGAIVPWGMVSVSPHTALGSKSGYIHKEPYLYGFGHVQLSGVGCSDLGNIVLMPTVGDINITPETYKTSYSNEKASPGYYSTTLKPSGIIAEMTATTRSGISKYAFPAGTDSANILIDVSITQNKKFMPALGHVKIVSDTEVEGWTESGHFCGSPNQVQKVYFVAKFSQPAKAKGTWTAGKKSTDDEQLGRGVGAYLNFSTKTPSTVYVKVGISYVSTENARINLDTEQSGFNFNTVHQNARKLWEKELSKIETRGGTATQKTIFYTGLYHMLIHPSVFSDVNGDYLTMGDKRVAKAKDYTRYNVFSLWDTYRNLHPFLTLFYPERQHDMVVSMLEMYKESNWLPKWELAGADAYVMVGDPVLNVLAGTYMNGLRNFDVNLAYEAMKHNATEIINNPIRPNLKEYLMHQYVPVDFRGSVSQTLEYAMADYSLAQMAKVLGHDEDYKTFMQRAQYYKNLYDPSTGFLRPKTTDGSWHKPFNPNKFKADGYIEGSAWNYLFFVPFDVEGLTRLMGGAQNYIKKLQRVFDEGKYASYNEPDIAFPYLFTYFDKEEWRTQKAVRESMTEDYNTTPGGLPGNDDCGTLSAWYVFSAIGFYPANPVSGDFRLGSPIFKKVTLHLNQKYYKGKTFVVKAKNASEGNIYVTSKKLNKLPYYKSYITHEDIQKGGSVEFIMSDEY